MTKLQGKAFYFEKTTAIELILSTMNLEQKSTEMYTSAFSPGDVARRAHLLAGIASIMLMLFNIYNVTLVSCFSLLQTQHL